MNKLTQAVRRRRAARDEYRRSIHYAIDHAISDSDRNELITFANRQGVQV